MKFKQAWTIIGNDIQAYKIIKYKIHKEFLKNQSVGLPLIGKMQPASDKYTTVKQYKTYFCKIVFFLVFHSALDLLDLLGEYIWKTYNFTKIIAIPGMFGA